MIVLITSSLLLFKRDDIFDKSIVIIFFDFRLPITVLGEGEESSYVTFEAAIFMVLVFAYHTYILYFRFNFLYHQNTSKNIVTLPYICPPPCRPTIVHYKIVTVWYKNGNRICRACLKIRHCFLYVFSLLYS